MPGIPAVNSPANLGACAFALAKGTCRQPTLILLSALPGAGRLAIDKGGDRRARLRLGHACELHVEARLVTGRIGLGRGAGHGERLATAAAPVDLAQLARAARLAHPVSAPEGLERL